ncbi:O-antigen polymerase [Sungkyunkwania multivorans]|uniref:O-antigen polymerase n=1 Tax=Sungkyunkwania multivorans TaxID=1173618 RepID=A0ABW3D009_9FLAO
MTISYILIVVLLLHIIIFKKMIFKWNLFGVFFIATILFSTFGILAFPFIKSYVAKEFWTFNLKVITQQDIVKTQLIAVSGLLMVLYAYVAGIMLRHRRLACISHFNIQGEIKDNLNRTNFYFIVILIGVFLFFYLLMKREVLVTGFFDGLLSRQPDALFVSRRGITSNYLYVVTTYNLLPFLTIVSLYLAMKQRDLFSKLLFIGLLLLSFILTILLFQKRPLVIFLLATMLAAFVFRKNIPTVRLKKVRSKKATRRRNIIYLSLIFALLLLLYYSATTYKFDTIFEAVGRLTEVVLTRVFGRLSIPAFFYVHYYPAVDGHYGFTNIGLFSKIFRFEHYADSRVLFDHFSLNKKGGSLAINSIMDFYGAFGYIGLIIGNIFLGFLLALVDSFLNKLEKNNINLVFIIFCFVFSYYLSQASLPRSLLGYGFFFFALLWAYLQKGFKIKLR